MPLPQVVVCGDQTVPRISDDAEFEIRPEPPFPKYGPRGLHIDMACAAVSEPGITEREPRRLGNVEEDAAQPEQWFEAVFRVRVSGKLAENPEPIANEGVAQ